ncbi:MAG: conjugative transposon protein TraM [Sphingobacterium sp.]|uniref:conjugative transposon protein TraM n=1 Tax=Sphingobacterium sp. JB170 TaxID=1434842 RepID=UPI00097F08CB|nr:conjugative transposon protein TraM [Sphingobacterium sp. JB170]SJN26855.1 Conjugative transposon protein TraM [Sphingobacterium sp. JB170]
MNKPKIIVISVISILVLAFFLIIYKAFIADDSPETKVSQSTVPKLKPKEKFTYEDMMKYREANNKSVGRAKINIQGDTLIDTLNFKISEEGSSLFANSEDIEEEDITPLEEETPRYNSASNNSGGGGHNSYTPTRSNTPTKSTKDDLYNTQAYTDAYEEIKHQNEAEQQSETYSSDPISEPKDEPKRRRREGFIGGSTSSKSTGGGVNVIVFGDQLIDQGESLKLRVTNNAKVNGVSIARNSIAYGVVSKAQNRLNITVTSIQSGGKSIPVSLTAYDATDGMAGLKVTQQEVDYSTENMKSQAGEEILSATGVTSLPIIGSLGRGAKDLLTRRKTTTSIVVGANYKLILK